LEAWNAKKGLWNAYPLVIGHEFGYVTGAAWRPLAMVPGDLWLRRPAARTLELEVSGGGVFLNALFERLYRDRNQPLPVGAVLDRDLFQVEIMSATAVGPKRIAFHFERDLTDPSLALLAWRDGALAPAELPEVGGALFLERSLGPAGF